MDFIESMRRGVDRAGFEVDRLLRANRVRSRINALRSQMDEEERQIGHHVLELYRQGEPVPPGVVEHCERVKRCQAEVAERESELEAINREVSPADQQESPQPARPLAVACPTCGATLPQEANFCLRCGAGLKPPPQQPTT